VNTLRHSPGRWGVPRILRPLQIDVDDLKHRPVAAKKLVTAQGVGRFGCVESVREILRPGVDKLSCETWAKTPKREV
jgi:hypothetical protein